MQRVGSQLATRAQVNDRKGRSLVAGDRITIRKIPSSHIELSVFGRYGYSDTHSHFVNRLFLENFVVNGVYDKHRVFAISALRCNVNAVVTRIKGESFGGVHALNSAEYPVIASIDDGDGALWYRPLVAHVCLVPVRREYD